MKTITKIAQQKKNKQRYSIYLNDEYAFGVEEEIIIKYHLHKGKELTEEELHQLLDDELFQKAYTMAVRYLSYRMRTIDEMEAYLRKQETEEMVLQKVIVRLMDENYLNDETYAKAFVADRKLLTSKGPKVIQRELTQKGIDENIVLLAIETYHVEEQLEKAMKWAQREWKKKSKHPAKKKKRTIVCKIDAKRFSKDIISEVIASLQDEDTGQTDREILQKQMEKTLSKYKKKYSGYDLKMRVKASLYQRGFSGDLINEYMEKIDESL